eukprot:UN12182
MGTNCCKEVNNWLTEEDIRKENDLTVYGYVHQHAGSISIDVIKIICLFYEINKEFIDYSNIPDGDLIYDGRGSCYRKFSFIWCKCLESDYRISTTKIIIKQWMCCYEKIDVIPVDSNIHDVQRQQTCCCCLCSTCCSCCVKDSASIIIFADDETRTDELSYPYSMNNVFNSTDVFNKLVRVIQYSYMK